MTSVSVECSDHVSRSVCGINSPTGIALMMCTVLPYCRRLVPQTSGVTVTGRLVVLPVDWLKHRREEPEV